MAPRHQLQQADVHVGARFCTTLTNLHTSSKVTACLESWVKELLTSIFLLSVSFWTVRDKLADCLCQYKSQIKHPLEGVIKNDVTLSRYPFLHHYPQRVKNIKDFTHSTCPVKKCAFFPCEMQSWNGMFQLTGWVSSGLTSSPMQQCSQNCTYNILKVAMLEKHWIFWWKNASSECTVSQKISIQTFLLTHSFKSQLTSYSDLIRCLKFCQEW